MFGLEVRVVKGIRGKANEKGRTRLRILVALITFCEALAHRWESI
jgi:hypothetical protein